MKRLDKAMSGWLRETILDPALWITLIACSHIAFLGDEMVLRGVGVGVGVAVLVAVAGPETPTALVTEAGYTVAGIDAVASFLEQTADRLDR